MTGWYNSSWRARFLEYRKEGDGWSHPLLLCDKTHRRRTMMSGDDRQNSPSISRQNRPSATARHLRSMQKFQDQNKTEVFISHSSVDLAFSRAIATDLMDAGFSVFLDDWSINIGERIFEKISTGLCESKALIMIISKDYLKSVCCTDEWGAFYGKALHDKSCVIYPIIIDDSAPPALISQIKYLRFNGDEYASALSTLLRSLRKQFSK